MYVCIYKGGSLSPLLDELLVHLLYEILLYNV